MNLKIGGSNVGKIMYGGQEFGGAFKLESGTILYQTNSTNGEKGFKDVHLLSTTKNWSNLNGININVSFGNGISVGNFDIPSDDLKNLDIERQYDLNGKSVAVSRTIVDGEYRLNVVDNYIHIFVIKAI